MDTVVITSSDIVTSTAMVNRYLVVIPGWVTRQVIMLVGVLMVVVPAAMVEVTMVVLLDITVKLVKGMIPIH